MNCEHCGKPHGGTVGSGRFCSRRCACAFSTAEKRAEINLKVSKTLTGRRQDGSRRPLRFCALCNTPIDSKSKAARIRCEACKLSKTTLPISSATRAKMSKSATARIERGCTPSIGLRNAIQVHGKTIRCDSILERAGILYILDTFDVVSIQRATVKISYVDNERIRTYVPDFEVQLSSGEKMLVECKSTNVGYSQQWMEYRRLAPVKRQSLEHFCKSFDWIPLWFTESTSRPHYKRARRETPRDGESARVYKPFRRIKK